MKKYFKRIFALCMAASMLFGITGCEGNTTDGSFQPKLDTDTKLTLSVVGKFGNFEALDAAAIKFQEYYPNIEVEYTPLANYYEDLNNRFSTGKEIDLYTNDWMNFYDAERQQFIYDGTEDLNNVDLDLSNMDQNYLSYATNNGQLYGIPCYVNNSGMIVNTDILEQCGLSIPESYDEFIDCLEALKKAGYTTPLLTYNSTAGYSFIHRYMELIKDGAKPQDAMEDTLETAEEFYDMGYVHPDSLTLEDDYNSLILRFLEGDIPFAAVSSGNYSGVKKREAKSDTFTKKPFSYTYHPFPVTEEKNATYMANLGTLYFSVYKDSSKLDYANEFLRFLSTDDTMKLMASEKNAPTSTPSGMELFPYLKDAKKFYMSDIENGAILEEAGMDGLSNYILFDSKQSETKSHFNDCLSKHFDSVK